jgi:hypothetical protein
MPKARALIEGASLGPEALKAACEAFDAAWTAIASHFKDQTEIEAARLTLASAILSVTDNSSRDVETLKHLGLQAMARKYASELPFPADVKLLDEKHWRDKAEETRRLARLDPDPVMKQGSQEIAQGYDRLADLMRERDNPNGHTTMKRR